MGKCLKQSFRTLLFVVLISQFQFSNAIADTVTKPHTWVDGETPTAALWNANEDSIITGVNNVASAQITDATIVNADISGSAAIAYSKLNLANSLVTGDITDGAILNADINASAAIVDTKLATISTVGKVSTAALTIGSQATGDLLYASAATTWARLPIGTSAQVLLGGTIPSWGTVPLPSGSILQVVSTLSSAVDTTTATIPADDTLPQAGSEGKIFLTRTITPTASGNLLKIHCTIALNNGSLGSVQAFLSEATSDDALFVGGEVQDGGSGVQTITFTHYYTTTGTSQLTFELSGGSYTAGTVTFNGVSGARLYGAAIKSSIVIEEVKA